MMKQKFKKAAKIRKIKAFLLTILVLGTLGSLLLYSTDTEHFLELVSSLSENEPNPPDPSINYP